MNAANAAELLSKPDIDGGLIGGASLNSTRKHSGSYSWKAEQKVYPAIEYTFSPLDISSFYNRGYLRFYVYVSNLSYKGNTATVELTSSGRCDDQEITFNVDNQIKSTGWNEIVVELSNGSKGSSTEFDRTACNYFRFYALDSNMYYYLDDIDFLYEDDGFNGIIISECESTTNLNGASLSDFSMYGEHCWRNNDRVNATFAYSFNSIDISSYMSDGYVCFCFYCEDLDRFGTRMEIELTSGGIWDSYEIYRNLTSYITKEGWNEVIVPLSEMKPGSPGTTFDPTALNFIRIFTLESNCYFYVDHIAIMKQTIRWMVFLTSEHKKSPHNVDCLFISF